MLLYGCDMVKETICPMCPHTSHKGFVHIKTIIDYRCRNKQLNPGVLIETIIDCRCPHKDRNGLHVSL